MTLPLADKGVRGLINKARDEKPELFCDFYSSPCEVCYDLLSEIFPSSGIIPKGSVG